VTKPNCVGSGGGRKSQKRNRLNPGQDDAPTSSPASGIVVIKEIRKSEPTGSARLVDMGKEWGGCRQGKLPGGKSTSQIRKKGGPFVGSGGGGGGERGELNRAPKKNKGEVRVKEKKEKIRAQLRPGKTTQKTGKGKRATP